MKSRFNFLFQFSNNKTVLVFFLYATEIMLVNKQIYFENHHHKKNFIKKITKSHVCRFYIFVYFPQHSIQQYQYRELNFVSNILPVDLLNSGVVIYKARSGTLFQNSLIFILRTEVVTKTVTSAVILLTFVSIFVLQTVVVTKPLPSTNFCAESCSSH